MLGQTSMPIGGISTNCVIAAHRGWNGKAMFRDVELRQEGDLVYLTNLWETLTYQVTGISIIWPDEVEAVAIQPGQDMVTLLTCHPYIVGTYRYLVFCQRVEDEAPIQPATTTTPDVQQEQATAEASQPDIELEKHLQLAALGLSICTAVMLIYSMITTNPTKNRKTGDKKK